jgi:asparagine synthase (glutamine-hydrolysing)
MSGIAGIYSRDGSPLPSVTPMLRDLQHRSPDGVDRWEVEECLLSYLKLNTSSPPRSGLCQETPCQIVFDGRLDNRQNLIKSLGIHDVTISDAALALNAYRRWGVATAEHLLGDFAFVLYDATQKQIYAARDQIGARPLNYYLSDSTFIFASESRAIASVPDHDFAINDLRIADYLLGYEYADHESTFFTTINRLPPAHWLLVTPDRVQKQRYWSLSELPDLGYSSDEDYEQHFRELLQTCVDCRLRDVPSPAVMLSGGVDSAAITGIGLQLRPDLAVYSAVSKDAQSCGDTLAIRQLEKHLQFESYSYTTDVLQKDGANLEQAFLKAEDPFVSFMTLAFTLYCQAAARDNHVILDGVEGDLVLSLPSDYAAVLFRQGNWRTALHETLHRRAHTGTRTHTALLKMLRAAIAPFGLRDKWFKRRFKRQFPGELKDSLLAERFHSRTDELVDRYQQVLQPQKADRVSLQNLQKPWLCKPYLNSALERYDKVAAACGVEARHPLLDKRIVEFGFQLPWDQKVRDGCAKHLLRRSTRDLIPDSVRWRRDKPHLGGSFTLQWCSQQSRRMQQYFMESTSWQSTLSADKVLEKEQFSELEPVQQEYLWMAYFLVLWLNRYQ